MMDRTRTPGSEGPPWSVDLLADLHAGVLDRERSARLWPQVNADPQARAVLNSLDTVKVELGRLGNAPVERMPPHVAARLDAAIAAETRRAQPGPRAAGRPKSPSEAPVVDLAEAQRRRNRRVGWAAGVLTAAAAAVAVTIAVFPPSTQTGGDAVAKPTVSAARPPLALRSDNLAAAVGGVTNERDYGPLVDQQRLDQCITANDIDPSKAQTVGVRQVTLNGRPGVLALLTTGEPGRFRVLVVEPTCGPDNPGTMANTLLPG
jgi:hypothetical protein